MLILSTTRRFCGGGGGALINNVNWLFHQHHQQDSQEALAIRIYQMAGKQKGLSNCFGIWQLARYTK